MIRLDTHVVVWLYTGEVERFSAVATERLEHDELELNPVVELELGFLHEIGRLAVPGQTVVADLAARVSLGKSDQTMDSVVAAAAPLTWTRDPFDRLIVGDALSANTELLTKDQTIRANCALARW